MRLLAVLALLALLGCGPAQPAAPASPPKPAPQAAEPAKPAAESKPAAPAPAAQPAKPAAEAKPAAAEAKPAAQPAKPAAEKPAAAMPSRILMGTPNVTSGYYAYTVAMAKLLQAKIPGLSITLSEGAGGIANAKRMVDGGIDFSIATLVGLYPAVGGLDPAWKDKPLKEARTLWVMDPSAYAWFVREDSGVTSYEQLQGKAFSGSGQGTSQDTLARLLLFPALGVEPRWYIGGMDDAQSAVKDRRIVGMGKVTPLKNPDSLIVDVMVTTKIRILSWTPEQVQKVQAKYPFLSTVEIPAGVYKAEWNTKPIVTWGDGLGVWTLAKFNNDLGYQMTKWAIEDNKPGAERIQAATMQSLKDLDLVQLTMSLSPYPLHAGAQKYYQEIGAKIPEHMKSPEFK